MLYEEHHSTYHHSMPSVNSFAHELLSTITILVLVRRCCISFLPLFRVESSDFEAASRLSVSLRAYEVMTTYRKNFSLQRFYTTIRAAVRKKETVSRYEMRDQG